LLVIIKIYFLSENTINDRTSLNQEDNQKQSGVTWRCVCRKDLLGRSVGIFLSSEKYHAPLIIIHNRFSTNEFKENVQSTLGAQFITHSIEENDCIMQFDIWDTAGQERFQALGALYYKNSKGALVVYDITSEKSFQRAKNWISELMENAEPDI
jgi:signal recognition particle receptor subunit beta